MKGTGMTGRTRNAGPVPSYCFICKYCSQTFNKHCVLVLHKLESHPLEYAEKKRTQNGIEPSSNHSSGGHMNGPLEAHKRTDYSYCEHHNQIHSSSMALNEPLLTRAQAMEKGERGRTPKSISSQGSCKAGQLPPFLSGIWQELDAPMRPITIQPLFIYREEPSVTLQHHPHNSDLPLENNRPEHLVQERTCPTTPQKYQSLWPLELSGKSTDEIELNDAPVPTDTQATGEISKQQHGGIDGHDEFQSFQQIPPLGTTHDCFICDGKFLTSEALGNHYRSHMEGALYKCQHCSYGFTTMLSRLKHLFLGKCAGYSVPRWRKKIPNSSVEYARGDALQQKQTAPPKRIRRSHDAEVRLDQRRGLAQENNYGVPIVTSNGRKIAKPPIRALIQCPRCTKRVSCQSLFQVDLRVHSMDKLYSCDACEYKFANFQGWATHSMSRGCGARKASLHGISDVISIPEQYEQSPASGCTATFYLTDGANDPQGNIQTSQTSASIEHHEIYRYLNTTAVFITARQVAAEFSVQIRHLGKQFALWVQHPHTG